MHQYSDKVERYEYNEDGQISDVWCNEDQYECQSRYYANGENFAYWLNGSMHFQHNDYLGTVHARTYDTGAPPGNPDIAREGTYYSLPWGDGKRYASGTQTPGGTDDSNAHFAELEHDQLDINSDTDQALNRTYVAAQGSWLQPDPYDGSYESSDPQSFNRYAYARNNPLALSDPAGLQSGGPCHGDPTGCGSSGSGDDGWLWDAISYIFDSIWDLFGFGGAGFEGSISDQAQQRRLLTPGRKDPNPLDQSRTVSHATSFSYSLMSVGYAPGSPQACIQSRANGKALDYSQPIHNGMTTQQHIQSRHMPGVGKNNVSTYWTQDWAGVGRTNYFTFLWGDATADRGGVAIDFTFPNFAKWLTGGRLENGIGYDANGNDTLTNHLVLMSDCKTVITSYPIE